MVMSADGQPQVLQTDQGRTLVRKEIKRRKVQYRLAANRPDAVHADLVLTDRTIVIENRDEGTVYKEILLEDFIGAEIISTSSADACWLEINSFPATEPSSKSSRQSDVDAVMFPTTNAEGIRNILEWRNALRQECERAVRKTFVFEEEGMVDSGNKTNAFFSSPDAVVLLFFLYSTCC